MASFLNAVELFGKTLENWNVKATKGWSITALVLLSIIAALLLIYLIRLLIKRKSNAAQNSTETIYVKDEEKSEPPVQEKVIVEREIVVEKTVEPQIRELLYISLNTDNVLKEYTVGDAVNHEGLVVLAHFNLEPVTENVTDYSVITPDMSKAGKPTVTVSYQDKTVGYQITVKPAPKVEVEEAPVKVKVATPVIIEEESAETGKLRYDKSFTARLIQSEDQTKFWYTDIKNELHSYKSVSERMSWPRETFRCRKEPVARLAFRGKTLCLFLPLNAAEYIEKYHAEEVTDSVSYEDTPLMMRLKNNRRVENAKLLIGEVMKQKNVSRLAERPSVDYYVPYEGIVELIKKGLIKRVITNKKQEAFLMHDAFDASSEDEEDETFGLEEVSPGIYVTKKD